LYLVQIIECIDDFIHSKPIKDHYQVQDLTDTSVLPLDFIISMLTEDFITSTTYVTLIGLMFRSLRIQFVGRKGNIPLMRGGLDGLRSQVTVDVLENILSICYILADLSVRVPRERAQFVKKLVRTICDGLDFVTFCVSSWPTNLEVAKDIEPMFRFSKDIGIASRLIILGVCLKAEPLWIAKRSLYVFRAKCVSDLSENHVILPLGMPGMDDAVNPLHPGCNWRLVVYCMLQFCSFGSFPEVVNEVMAAIDHAAVQFQVPFVLVDVLATRLREFRARFNDCLRMGAMLLDFALKQETIVLRAVLRLLKGFIAVKSDVKVDKKEIIEFCDGVRKSFQKMRRVESKAMYAQVTGSLEILAGDTTESEGSLDDSDC
jgi:hypothetical protein